MKPEDYLSIDGFKKTLANKIYENIQKQIHITKLPELMAASNIFGRGFGDKKLKIILDIEPNIIQDYKANQSNQEIHSLIMRISKIQGLANKTAEQFVNAIPEFIAFIKDANLEYKLKKQEDNKDNTNHTDYTDNTNHINHQLKDKKIVMTGFRNKELEDKLKDLGADITTSVSKNTNIVLVKSKTQDTGKAEEARKLNIPIMTQDEFKEKYKI